MNKISRNGHKRVWYSWSETGLRNKYEHGIVDSDLSNAFGLLRQIPRQLSNEKNESNFEKKLIAYRTSQENIRVLRAAFVIRQVKEKSIVYNKPILIFRRPRERSFYKI